MTDRTVGFVLSTLAIVVGVQALVDTHSAVMAVLEIFSAAHPTKAAVCAMVWFFVICHPQIANIAMIFSELDSARDAVVPAVKKNETFQSVVTMEREQSKVKVHSQHLRFAALLSVAFSTDNFLDGKSINCVVRIFW